MRAAVHIRLGFIGTRFPACVDATLCAPTSPTSAGLRWMHFLHIPVCDTSTTGLGEGVGKFCGRGQHVDAVLSYDTILFPKHPTQFLNARFGTRIVGIGLRSHMPSSLHWHRLVGWVLLAHIILLGDCPSTNRVGAERKRSAKAQGVWGIRHDTFDTLPTSFRHGIPCLQQSLSTRFRHIFPASDVLPTRPNSWARAPDKTRFRTTNLIVGIAVH